jgi:hypothetical protein
VMESWSVETVKKVKRVKIVTTYRWIAELNLYPF